ncbi:Endoglucanase precursor [compost metagenome]
MKRKISLIMVLGLIVNLFMGALASVDAESSTLANPTVSPTELNTPLNSKLNLNFGTSKVKTNGTQTYTITEGFLAPVSVSVTENVYSNSITFTPPALKYNTDYKITFPEGAFIDENGVTSSLISWRFSTVQATTKPTASYYPAAGSSSVSASVQPAITFDRNVALNTAKWGSTGGITLRKTSNNASVSLTVSVSGKTVTIRPTSNLEADTPYYIEVPSDAIYDAANNSNYFSGLSGTSAWSFRTAGVADKVAPVLQNATMYSNAVIRLQYNESLSYSSYLSSSHFSVTVNGDSRRVSSASVSGEYVYVYLDLGVAVGQDVRISYSGSGSKAIQDQAGNAAVNFSGKVVTNGMDSVLPKPKDGSANRYSVTLYFSDTLKSPSSYAYQQFVVTGDGSSKGVTSLSHSGSSITLNLSNYINDGEVVKVSYTPGSYPLQDYRGIDIAAFSDYYVRNNYDTKAPELQGATGSGNKIVLTYNEALRTSSTPLKSQFSVLVNNSPVYVTAVEVTSSQVILTLASSLTKDQNVTVSYVSGSGGIADLNGNLAGYINLQPVSYGTVAEGVRQATIKGDTVTITYNSTLKAISYFPVNQFYVTVDGVNRTIQSGSISGDTVTLKLTAAVTANQAAEVSYVAGSTPMYDYLGNLLKGYSKIKLQNLDATTSTTDNKVQPSYISVMSTSDFGVGGYLLNQSAAQTASSRSKNGQWMNKYVLDSAKVQGAFNYLVNNNVSVKNLVFEVPSTEKAAEVAIPLSSLSALYSTSKTATFSVKHNNVMYTLPIEKIPFMEITRSLSVSNLNSSYLTIQMEPVSKTLMSSLNSKNGVTTSIVSDPVQLTLSAYDTGKSQSSVDVTHTGKIYFKAANQASTAYASLLKYSPVNYAASYIPSSATTSGANMIFNGKVTGNSIIGPVVGYSYFSDVYKHWAKDAIFELASKLIVEPRSGASFAPDKSITRAEFAVFIAKGLGLEGDETSARRFTDVTSGTTAEYIGAAAKAGIITGNTDGSFKPENYITREQMALMMVRAMDYSGYNTQLSGSSAQYLSKFKDSAKIQNKETVAKAVREGIIQGVTTNTFQPQGNATRAQAVVMLKRVLDKLN